MVALALFPQQHHTVPLLSNNLSFICKTFPLQACCVCERVFVFQNDSKYVDIYARIVCAYLCAGLLQLLHDCLIAIIWADCDHSA